MRDEVHPYDKNYFRTAAGLTAARDRLDGLWERVREGLHGGPADVVRTREAAAMVAHARWMYAAASRRTETRGMHKRLDHPDHDPAQRRRLVVGGLDAVWTEVDPVAPTAALAAAA